LFSPIVTEFDKAFFGGKPKVPLRNECLTPPIMNEIIVDGFFASA